MNLGGICNSGQDTSSSGLLCIHNHTFSLSPFILFILKILWMAGIVFLVVFWRDLVKSTQKLQKKSETKKIGKSVIILISVLFLVVLPLAVIQVFSFSYTISLIWFACLLSWTPFNYYPLFLDYARQFLKMKNKFRVLWGAVCCNSWATIFLAFIFWLWQ